ncbi:hypothetical protein TRFO_01594 [Tritrichomonas foetus]|uniref:Uncharacterized protein n=1 Tax=Tritrichomonas foetus TaxID=1144522 RepID=A0A1J4JXI7_9EUKA|nr:hypothetical protein TRFO_01594 [Tritrichomonas foetus]|eukprot:OHT03865.1 hypothetical protein TRFO_01594 [Tritrichomonas foetus]
MNQKRGSPKDPYFLYTKSIIEASTTVLKGVEKDSVASSARISFWNSLFPDNQYSLEAPVRQLLVDILRRHVIQITSVQRFCFELSALFIDLPGDFAKIISFLPYPYVTAMHISFRALNELIELPQKESTHSFIEKVIDELSPQKLTQLQTHIAAMQSDSLNIERIVNKVQQLLQPDTFDMFLQILPPHLRLHYALKYGRPYPRVKVDFERVRLPPDFIQAVADIEGAPAAIEMVAWNDSVNTKEAVPPPPEGI